MRGELPEALRRVPARPGVWRTYDATDGLSGGCSGLFQDKRGVLWATTGSGLCRFDGRQFTYFTSAHGLPPKPLNAIREDPDGRLWLGSLGGGICHFDGRRASVLTTADGLAGDDVVDFEFDAEGRLWIATWDHGASCFENGRFTTFTTADGLGQNTLRSLHCDQQGRVWFGTNSSGVSCLADGQFTTYGPAEGLLHSRVVALGGDSAGRIWMGTPGGLNCWEHGRIRSYSLAEGLPHDHVRCIYEDAEGRLWLGFNHSGLACIDGDALAHYTVEDGLFYGHVGAVIRDREGLVWCAHPQVGLSRLDAVSVEPLTSLPVTETLSMDNDNRLWFGSDNDIACLSPGGNIQKAKLNYRVYAMAKDRDGRIWIGTGGGGLFHFPNRAAVFDGDPGAYAIAEVTPTNITSLLLARSGHLYIGTACPGEIYCWDGRAFTRYPTRNTAVYCMAEDADGRIWFGGGGAHWAGAGLGCFEGGRIAYYTEADGLPCDAVTSLLTDTQGRLWIGTQYGLCVRQEGRISGLNEDDGLPPYNLCALQDGKGRLWFGTAGSGVYCYDGTQFQQLTTADGLPGNNVAGLVLDEDGHVVIGTHRGAVRYHPAASRPPMLDIRKILADRVYANPVSLELTTTQTRLLSVVFQATSLAGHRFRYRYKLEGFDPEWRDTWATEATYENLPVGDYVFLVQAASRDFVYSEKPAEARLKVVTDPVSQLLAEHQEQLGRMKAEIRSREKSDRLHHALIELVRSKIMDEELHPALHRITETAANALNVDWASIWLCDPRQTRLQCIDYYERAAARHSRGENVLLTDGAADLHAVTHERVVCASNCLTDDRLAALPPGILPRQGVTSALAASVWHAGRFAGLALCAQKSQREWTDGEANFAAFLGDYVALALERAERRRAERALRASQDEERGFQQHLMALHELTNDLGQLETFDDVCRTAVSEGCSRLGFQSLSLWLKGNDDELMAAYATDEFGRVQAPPHGRRAPATPPWLLGRPIKELAGAELIEDAPLFNANGEFVRMGARAVAALWDGEETAGFLVTDNLARGKVITEHQCELLGLFASAMGHLAARRRADEQRRRLEAQVQQSQRLESLGVLAGGIAHDFNNILAAIFGHATLALEEVPPGSSTAESLTQVLRAGSRAKELVQQILAFSRHSEQVFKPVALDLVVQEALQFARATLPSPIEIVSNISLDSAYMLGNATQLHQVVMNLCTNAGQAMGADGGVIEISLEETDAPQTAEPALRDGAARCLRLTVRDTGCGMASEVVRRIFEPFFSTKAPGQGTGLGLSVVHGIVASHGGAITVDSMPNVGTAFHIHFPRVEAPQDEVAATPLAETRGDERILFVDDEEPLVHLAQKLLGKLGYTVATACNGAEALLLFKETPKNYDLVVTDRLMPHMTGEVLAQELKVLRPDVPILLTSGHFEEISPEKLNEYGISAVLTKPYSIQEFSAAVRNALDLAPERA